MKNLYHCGTSRNLPSDDLPLFLAARSRELRSLDPATRHIATRFHLTASTAGLLARLAGIGSEVER